MEGRVTDDAVFAGYEPDGFFDEVFAATGEPRDHYRRLVRDIELLGHDELARRARLRDAAFRTKGITFTVYGEERRPRAHVPDGPAAPHHPGRRVGRRSRPGSCSGSRALNRFLDDLYVGERAAIHDGIIPALAGHSRPTASAARPCGIPVPARRPLPRRRHRPRARRRRHVPRARGQRPQPERHLLRAREPGRDDRACCPRVFGDHAVRPVDHYGSIAARRAAPRARRRAATRPRVVVLTPGVVQLGLLRARVPGPPDGRRAGRGSRPRGRRPRGVHAHHARAGARRRDLPPHRRRASSTRSCFRPDSMLGVPGLLAAVRAGNVTHRERDRQRRGRRQGSSTPTCPTSSATTSARSRSWPTCRPTCCGTPTSGPRCSTGCDELVVKPVSGAGGYDVRHRAAASDERARRRCGAASRPIRAARSHRRWSRCRGTRP